MNNEAPVLTGIRGRAGIITLNRPQAMNALTHEMVTLIADALIQWRDHDEVDLIIIQGAGERAFCAGGDVVSLYEDALAEGEAGARFWAEEYELNQLIADYPKPYIALMHGFVLGGGVGVSAHGSHRIVTDSTRIGMPETGIGFIPDVGGSYLLAQAPDNLGIHMSLTGMHIGAADAIYTGFADFYIPEDKLEELVDKLVATGDVAAIDQLSTSAGEAFNGDVPAMAQAYHADSVEEILANLEKLDDTWAVKAAERIRRNSPTALKVSLESLQRAQGRTLAEALATEYRVSVNSQRSHDFIEGVRAQLVDKDRDPQWKPAQLSDITAQDVEAVFIPVRETSRI